MVQTNLPITKRAVSTGRWRSWVLVGIFLMTLPLANPWVRGDGVAYYAFIRAPLIEHSLNFEKDWEAANSSFRGRVDANGHLRSDQYTSTGHIDNHSSIGPAILWAPFIVIAHLTVQAADRMGLPIPPDGFSKPYREAMALGTALFGFLAIYLSFDLACHFFDKRWAFLGAVGIWFASSLPVYMYFNPSWSHAPSAFVVALFVWYWYRTQNVRTWSQWLLLGGISGLMIDVYYPNALLLLLIVIEFFARYWRGWRKPSAGKEFLGFASDYLVFGIATFVAFLPTLITKKILYGHFFDFGYTEHWFWWSPAILKVCFSSDHGLFTWTPILIFAVLGLFLLRRHDRLLGVGLPLIFITYLYLIGSYQDWDGLSSFGNRFFVSLTILFVLGLTATIDLFSRWRAVRGHAFGLTCALTLAFVIWNLGLVFQWGMQMIPARGSIDWNKAVQNQYAAVPREFVHGIDAYVFERNLLMQQIEEEDVRRIKSQRQQHRNISQ